MQFRPHLRLMHTTKEIEIAAPREAVFPIASDLENWPRFLPHYRSNRFLSPLPGGGIVKMAAVRSGIPLTWISIYRADAANFQMHFEHLKPTTRGMIVRWDFLPVPGGVRIVITHDFKLDWPLIGGFVADTLIGSFLVDHVAGLTLLRLKQRMETA